MRALSSFARYLGAACLLSIVMLTAPQARGQAPVGSWTAHTSLQKVTGLARSDSALWVATSGGVYRYGFSSKSIKRFTVTEGLHDVDVRAISYDASGPRVWVGYRDGVIDRIDVETGTVTSFQDIARAERFSKRDIYRLQARGDTLYAATAFGLVVFDLQKEEVRDSYTQLGDLNAASDVYDLTFADTPSGRSGLWLATESGVAHAPMQARNLKDPTSWTVDPMAASSDKLVARSIATFGGDVYVGLGVEVEADEDYQGDALGLYRRADDQYARIPPIHTEVEALFAGKKRLYGVGKFKTFEVGASGQARQYADNGLPSRPSDIIAGSGGQLWIGDVSGVVVAKRPPRGTPLEGTTIQPNSPYENNITDLYADERGRLIAGGNRGRNTGFYVLHPDGAWKNYTKRSYDALPNTNVSYERVYGQQDGHIWAGSYGDGVVMVTPDGEVKRFDETNSTLGGIPSNTSFIVVQGLDVDQEGRLWLTTQRNSDRTRALHIRATDGTWSALPIPLGAGRTYDRLYIDSYEQKWIITARFDKLRINDGLVVLDTKNTPSDASDDTYHLFDQEGEDGVGLPDLFITAVTEDRDGAIWVATKNGLARLLNTGVVADDPNAQFAWPQRENVAQGEDPYLLHGLAVNDIAIDASNQIWAATEQGVYHAERAERGYRVTQHFTTTNSPLPANSVQSVAVNDQTGAVYFATNQGLVAYQGEAVAPAEQRQDLTVYPNPVKIGTGRSSSIFITGLVEETEVRILTPDGRTVAQLQGRGGRVRWDGRNQQDQLVPSGVYLVVAVGQNGEGTAYGKVAVIR